MHIHTHVYHTVKRVLTNAKSWKSEESKIYETGRGKESKVNNLLKIQLLQQLTCCNSYHRVNTNNTHIIISVKKNIFFIAFLTQIQELKNNFTLAHFTH